MLFISGLWLAVFLLHHCFVLLFAGVHGVTLAGVATAMTADVLWALLLGAFMVILRGTRLRSLSGIVGVLLALFLMVSFGFAKLYQRPFSLAFVRLDTASIWKENFVSGLYELGWQHILLLALVLALCWFINRRGAALPKPALPASLAAAALALGGISFLAFAVPGGEGLFYNPLQAAFQSKPKAQAITAVALAENDLIPTLESPESTPFLRPVSVPRIPRKNVILYFLESTPYSMMGKKIQNKEITPNLNRLSERSLYFTRHYANFPLSINAFYNAFCSAYALPDGAWISLALPDFKVPCLSEVLGSEGYRAIALHAGYLGYAKQKRFMQKRGFRTMMDAETIKKPPFQQGMGPWGAADERSMIKPLTEFARAETSPFLALLFAFAPHHPYNMPNDFPDLIAHEGGLKKSQVHFYNSMHFADTAFGEIFAALEKNGVLKDSILIVFGDHGEAFYEHPGNYNHPFFLYEENIHVPLMVYVDGVKAQRIERVTSHVDILPTVLDLLKLEGKTSPLHVGRSMLSGGPQTMAHLQAFWQEEYSGIVDTRYKYIRKETGVNELYDLAHDPAEQNNLAQSRSEAMNIYRALTEKAFLQKKTYYKKHGNYDLTRFIPKSQDK